VRRWLRRATDTHLNWTDQQGFVRLIALNPDAFTQIRFTGNQLRYTLQVLAAAAYWDARACGFDDPSARPLPSAATQTGRARLSRTDSGRGPSSGVSGHVGRVEHG
jgi:hypothetical protein